MLIEGVPEVVSNIQQLRSTIMDASHHTAQANADYLFERTRAVVPYLSGDLYNAAYKGDISVGRAMAVWVVGYDTVAVPYAVRVHETPNRNHPTRGPSPEPKQDHYLSEPRDAMGSGTFQKTVKEDLERAIRARVARMRK